MTSFALATRHADEAEGCYPSGGYRRKNSSGPHMVALSVTDTGFCSRRIPRFVPNCCGPVCVSFACLETHKDARGSF